MPHRADKATAQTCEKGDTAAACDEGVANTLDGSFGIVRTYVLTLWTRRRQPGPSEGHGTASRLSLPSIHRQGMGWSVGVPAQLHLKRDRQPGRSFDWNASGSHRSLESLSATSVGRPRTSQELRQCGGGQRYWRIGNRRASVETPPLA